MKMNHMICPSCGHDFYTDCDYACCSACQCTFYAAQSKTCNPQPPSGIPTVTTIVTTSILKEKADA